MWPHLLKWWYIPFDVEEEYSFYSQDHSLYVRVTVVWNLGCWITFLSILDWKDQYPHLLFGCNPLWKARNTIKFHSTKTNQPTKRWWWQSIYRPRIRSGRWTSKEKRRGLDTTYSSAILDGRARSVIHWGIHPPASLWVIIFQMICFDRSSLSDDDTNSSLTSSILAYLPRVKPTLDWWSTGIEMMMNERNPVLSLVVSYLEPNP